MQTPAPRLAAAIVSVSLIAVFTGCASAPQTPQKTAPVTDVLALDDPASWPGDLALPLHAVGVYRYADVRINGQNAGRFLLDTGANRPVIDNGRANRFGLPDDGQGTTTGIAGQTATHYRKANHLELGPVTPATKNASAKKLPRNKLPGGAWLRSPPVRMIGLDMHKLGGKLGAGVGGILGFRSLGNVPFTLDPHNNTLTLHQPQTFRPPPGTTRARLHRFHGLPVVDATLFTNHNVRVPIRLLIDTGMNTALSLPRQLLEQHPAIASVPVSGHGNSRGIGGSLQSTNTWVRQTRVLGLDLKHLPVSFENMPPQLQPRDAAPQGRVGMAVLAHFVLTFDPQRNYVYAKYLPPTPAAASE